MQPPGAAPRLLRDRVSSDSDGTRCGTRPTSCLAGELPVTMPPRPGSGPSCAKPNQGRRVPVRKRYFDLQIGPGSEPLSWKGAPPIGFEPVTLRSSVQTCGRISSIAKVFRDQA